MIGVRSFWNNSVNQISIPCPSVQTEVAQITPSHCLVSTNGRKVSPVNKAVAGKIILLVQNCAFVRNFALNDEVRQDR